MWPRVAKKFSMCPSIKMFGHPCFTFTLVTCTLSRKEMQAICKLW